MNHQSRINIRWFIIGDALGAALTWLCFYYLRTVIYQYPFSIPPGFYIGAALYITGWISLHFLSGAYEGVYFKTPIFEILRTALVSIIGCVALLFFFILKNPHDNNNNYYQEFFSLLVPVFVITCCSRIFICSFAKNQLKKKQVTFPILLISSGEKVEQFYNAFTATNAYTGCIITSCINLSAFNDFKLADPIKIYHHLDSIDQIIINDHIEEVIISVEKNERELLTTLLRQLSDKNVNIKITADELDIISGAVQTNNLMGMPLIDVHSGILPSWQKNIKRFIDISIAFTGLVLLSPLLLFTAARTWFSSKGSIFFTQERIGYRGKPFTIYKFRSMVQTAEADGPMLSSSNDPRITHWGKTMRKWRLDELPQFWNIIKGEMSLVGPRPERKFYIDQIIQQHPEYKTLFKVKPGLSSWGMVKFGYASNVKEMIERMPYDIMYIENVSLGIDLKIMLHTLRTIFSGEGK